MHFFKISNKLPNVLPPPIVSFVCFASFGARGARGINVGEGALRDKIH